MSPNSLLFICILSQIIGTLEEVHMPQNGINHPGITALAQAFAINSLLRVINLNDNTFTEKGAVAMAEVGCYEQLICLSLTSWSLQIQLVSIYMWVGGEVGLPGVI